MAEVKFRLHAFELERNIVLLIICIFILGLLVVFSLSIWMFVNAIGVIWSAEVAILHFVISFITASLKGVGQMPDDHLILNILSKPTIFVNHFV